MTLPATPIQRTTTQPDEKVWWRNAIGYQVYPRSFADANGDGIGDLQGIISKLDYLAWLGIDVIWLSPVYASPQHDNGYDISDYHAIDPAFGTMDDFDELVAASHARGIRILMDLVVNHTSDEHVWFRESKSSRDNPKRDWYWWRPGKTDGEQREPNNWESRFSGPAWEYNEATDDYYLHIFAKQQPDLNWENPELRQAIYAMMRWWLDRGIDGFRMDVINFISKNTELPDGAIRPGKRFGNGRPHYTTGPRLHEYLQEMRREVFDGTDRTLLTIGETPQAEVSDAQHLTDPSRGELDMVFQFEHVTIDHEDGRWNSKPLSLPALKQSLSRWQDGLADRGWNTLYFNNHDQPRVVSRWGDLNEREASAKAWATVLHLHRGTPFVYQGEEIGMTNFAIGSVDDLTDVQSRNFYATALSEGLAPEQALDRIRPLARDHARTPMQWSNAAHAGFSEAQPWMTVNPNYAEINVEEQIARPDSVLSWYRELIQLRHVSETIALGRCRVLGLDDAHLYVLERELDGRLITMIANLSSESRTIEYLVPAGSTTLLDTHSVFNAAPVTAMLAPVLEPWRAVVLESAADQTTSH